MLYSKSKEPLKLMWGGRTVYLQPNSMIDVVKEFGLKDEKERLSIEDRFVSKLKGLVSKTEDNESREKPNDAPIADEGPDEVPSESTEVSDADDSQSEEESEPESEVDAPKKHVRKSRKGKR